MDQLQLIKIGGSVITDKRIPYTAKHNSIRNIAKKIKIISSPIIISHGSGSFGHTSARIYGGKHGYSSRWGLAKIARDAMEINRIVMDIFIEEKLPVISFRPLSFMISKSGKLEKYFFEPILLALKQKFIPVIYGDIIIDKKWNSTIFSGETILNYLCKYLVKKKYIIKNIFQLCNVDGVYDKKGKIIPHINNATWRKVKKGINNIDNVDVTGGILHKVENAIEIAKIGIKTTIINGTVPQIILPALNGEKIGTLISYN